MPSYEINLIVNGRDNASGALSGVLGSLQRIGEFAAGGLIASGIQSIGSAIGGLASQALQSVASYERLGASLQQLTAREIQNASGVEKTIQIGTQRIQLTNAEVAALEKLKGSLAEEAASRDTLAARIQEQKERIRQLTEAYGQEGLNVQTAKAKLAEMEIAYQKSGQAVDTYASKIAALESKQGSIAAITKTVIEGQLSMNEAMSQATPKVQELLDWIQRAAIKSPFTQESIANAFRQSMAYGFTTDEAKRLTQAMLDFSAGSGASESAMGQISLALGQIKARGTLAGQEILQLTNAGLPVREILAKAFGITTAELVKMQEKGLIPADKAIAAIVESLEKDFGGAAERQAGTFAGLISSLSDIKDVGLRELFSGIFGAAKPLIASFVDTLSSPEFFASVRAIGNQIGESFKIAIEWIQRGADWIGRLIARFEGLRGGGAPALAAIRQIIAELIPPEANAIVDGFVATLSTIGSFVATNVLPALFAFGEWIVGTAIPALLQFGAVVGANLVDVFGAYLSWVVSTALPTFRDLFIATFEAIRPSLEVIGAAINDKILPVLSAFVLWISGTALPALVQFGEAIVFPAFAELANVIGTKVLPLFAELAAFLIANALPAILEFAGQIGAFLLPILSQVATYFFSTIIPAIAAFVGYIADNIPGAIAGMIATVQSWLPFFDSIGQAFQTVQRFANAFVGVILQITRIFGEIISLVATMIAKFLNLDDQVANTSKAFDLISTAIGIISPIVEAFVGIVLQGIIDAFRSLVGLIESAIDALKNLADWLSTISIPDWLERHSPSEIEQSLMGMRDNLKEIGALKSSLDFGSNPLALSYASTGSGFSGFGSGGSGGIRIGDIIIQNPQVRSDRDIQELADRVGDVMIDRIMSFVARGSEGA